MKCRATELLISQVSILCDIFAVSLFLTSRQINSCGSPSMLGSEMSCHKTRLEHLSTL